MAEGNIFLSIIIPCKNEEKYLKKCIDSILKNKGKSVFEIIVVDNGSTDNTFNILKSYQDKILFYEVKGVTISELRNFGASKATGEWLAFVDADVEVDSIWFKRVYEAVKLLQQSGVNEKKIITGSTYGLPKNPTWVEAVWYNYLIKKEQKWNALYINGGNLIIHSEFFNLINGFDHLYETGEDEKLCHDAKKYGGKIIKNNSIRVIHHGYPKTITQFFKRELWHGKALIHNILRPWQDRALLLALFNILIFFIFLFLLYKINFVLSVLIGLILILSPLFVFSKKSLGKNNKAVIKLTFLFFIYGSAKTIALLKSFYVKLLQR